MLLAVLVWAGIAVAVGLMLVMAFGPLIVEVDARRYARRRARRADQLPLVAERVS